MNKTHVSIAGISSSAILAVLLVVAISNPSVIELEPTGIYNAMALGGVFTITHLDPNGEIISQEKVNNLVTNEAMECVADLVFNGTASCSGETTFSYIALGTTNTAPVDADTALNAEAGGCARVGDTAVAVDTGTTGQRTMTVSATFSGAGCEGLAFVETGIFDRSASSSGNMLATAVFSAITLSSGDSLQVDYDIVINNT